MTESATLSTPGIVRRLAAMLYELLLVSAVLAVALVLPHMLLGAFAKVQASHLAVKIHFFVVLLVYFTWFWLHGGQTLAMKTWKIRVVDVGGGRLRPAQAVLRYLAAWVSLGLGGIGIVWALFDRDGQFLHDRIADTRLVAA
ncbi:RDD family protein [Azospira restricta]|uniref:RDD family protein n=1 Tax=Azospira restricta TaxID=404405 RepID=A0A974SN86_9RHOO|nr:RDD family protein [Azospira restricta]QRJ63460.1 RDD family protein [Azospira restricta]